MKKSRGCDGQMSLFEKPIVDFSQCMNPPEEGNDEGVQSNTKDRKSEPQYTGKGTEQIAGDRNSTEVG